MIYRRQLFRHELQNEIYGDCHRTAIACLLDLEPWQVPHFGQLSITEPGYIWTKAVKEYLASQGLYNVKVFYSGDLPLETLLKIIGRPNPEARYLLGGSTVRGTDHTVVCCGDHIEWDPHPDDTGLSGPLSNGDWEVEFLIRHFQEASIDER